MSLLDTLHSARVAPRRARVLAQEIARRLPPNARVLDIGCGDGHLGRLIGELRADVLLQGVETLVRPNCQIPVAGFDGLKLPFEDGAFDVAMLVDVLHHTDDPIVLLKEASRVGPKKILIKDHTLTGVLAWQTLRLMDQVSNERHGVALPYNYMTKEQWEDTFRLLQLRTIEWADDIRLYPWPASIVFTRKLHFVADLTSARPAGIAVE